MGRIFVVCPECRRHLSFDEVPGYEKMVIECPRCKFKANVSVYQRGAQAQGGSGTDPSNTRLVTSNELTFDPGRIRVKDTDESHCLKIGGNVIGRCSKNGDADIKITNDMYMSRRHARIDVVRKETGFEHHLVEIGSSNPMKLNGKEVKRGDILMLHFGDVLTLGHTDIVFESSDEEATKLG